MNVLRIPYRIKLGSKKYSLSLNIYRNLHYQVNNKLKIEIKKYLSKFLIEPINNPVEITYKLFVGSKRRYDLDNIVVVAKYIQDALVEMNVLKDDDYKYIPKIIFEFGGFSDDKDGEIIIEIKEIK